MKAAKLLDYLYLIINNNRMKTYKIIKLDNMISASSLAKKAENRINNLIEEGWEILNVSFGPSGMGFSAFITIFR